MSDARRKSVALAVAVVMHASMFVSGLLVPKPIDVDFELEWELTEVELLDPDAIQGDDVNAEPVPPEPDKPPPTEEPPKEEPPLQELVPERPEVEEEGPKRDLGEKKSRVGKLGPPSANYHFLVSAKTIRKLPFGEDAMKMISPLPDFRYLVLDGGFDPLRDFDYILIASSDMRSLTQTFLAVDYRLSRDQVKAKIETAATKNLQTIEWKDHNGVLAGNPKPADGSRDTDPRHFVLLERKIAVLVRPEFLPALLKEEVGEEKTAANFVAELTKLRRYARRIPTAGVQFVAHDLHAALKRTTSRNGLPIPNEFEVTVEAQVHPEFHARAKYFESSNAVAALAFWNANIRDFVNSSVTTRMLLGAVVDDIEVEQNGREVTLWGELERAQIELMLKTIGSWVEKRQAEVDRNEKKRRAKALKKLEEQEAKKDKAP